MAFTLAEVTSFYTIAKAAYENALSGDQYTIGSGGSNRSLKRQSLEKLQATMEYWQSRIDILNGDSRKIKFATPRY